MTWCLIIVASPSHVTRLPVDDDVIEGSPLHVEQVCVQGSGWAPPLLLLLLQRSDVIGDEPLQVGARVRSPDGDQSSVWERVTCPRRAPRAVTPESTAGCARAVGRSEHAAQ